MSSHAIRGRLVSTSDHPIYVRFTWPISRIVSPMMILVSQILPDISDSSITIGSCIPRVPEKAERRIRSIVIILPYLIVIVFIFNWYNNRFPSSLPQNHLIWLDTFDFMSNVLWNVIFGICLISRVLRQDLVAHYNNYSQQEITHEIKSFQPNLIILHGVIILGKTFSKQYGNPYNLSTRAKS